MCVCLRAFTWVYSRVYIHIRVCAWWRTFAHFACMCSHTFTCVCVCVHSRECIYVSVFTCVYSRSRMCMFTYMCSRLPMCMFACMCLQWRVCMFTWVYSHVCIHVCVFACSHTCVHMCVFTCACVHVHMQVFKYLFAITIVCACVHARRIVPGVLLVRVRRVILLIPTLHLLLWLWPSTASPPSLTAFCSGFRSCSPPPAFISSCWVALLLCLLPCGLCSESRCSSSYFSSQDVKEVAWLSFLTDCVRTDRHQKVVVG
jgi:hypothetical protein